MRIKTATWFEVGVRYHRTQEDGSGKTVTEKYTVDALSFTEAECAIIEEMGAYISGDFKIKSEVQANYGEVIFSDNDDDDKWYKAKLSFINIDEKNGKEKRTNVNYLVQAKSMQKALKNIEDIMRTLANYEVVGLAETKVIDVFEHQIKSHEDKEE